MNTDGNEVPVPHDLSDLSAVPTDVLRALLEHEDKTVRRAAHREYNKRFGWMLPTVYQ